MRETGRNVCAHSVERGGSLGLFGVQGGAYRMEWGSG